MRHLLSSPVLLLAAAIPTRLGAGEAVRPPPPSLHVLSGQDPDNRLTSLRALAGSDRPETVDRIVQVAAAASRRLQGDLDKAGRELESELRRCHAAFAEYARTPEGVAAFHARRDHVFNALCALEEAEREEASALKQAAEALGRMRDPGAVRRIIAASRRQSPRPFTLALVQGLERSAAPEAAARLAEMAAAAGDDLAVRVAAAEALAAQPAEAAVPLLLDAFPRAPAPVQWAILRALDRLDDPAAIPPLIRSLDGAIGRTRGAIEETLARLCGRPRTGDAAGWEAWWSSARPAFPLGRPDRAAREIAAFGRETVPTFLGLPVSGRAVVFCVDLSTSMEEAVPIAVPGGSGGGLSQRADHVRTELERALRALPRGARFNVILFAWHLRILAPGRLLPATPGNVESALALMRETRLRHGTSLGDALDRALGLGRDAGGAVDPAHAPDAIYLLSDGDPTTGTRISSHAIRQRVRDLNAVTRTAVHAIGIAPDARSEAFLRALAAENGGRFVCAGTR